MFQRIKQTGRKRAGFTLIELMLAMGFISVLLIAISLTVIQVSATYSRGIALKEVNQAARNIASDIRRVAADSDPITLSTDFVTSTSGGRICFGTYSYIWNTAKALQDGASDRARYSGDANRPIQLVKVADISKMYCAKRGTVFANRDIVAGDVGQAQELVATGDQKIGINAVNLSILNSAINTKSGAKLYTLTYILGAGDVSAMNPTQTACITKEDVVNTNLNYCTVQTFTIVLRQDDWV